jgi:chromosome segregation ATPase
MAEILTTNQLAEFEASVMRALRGESAGPSLAFVRLVYSSHEALRAALDAERKRADDARTLYEASETVRMEDNERLSREVESCRSFWTKRYNAQGGDYSAACVRATRAEANLAAARARVEELEREAVIDLHSTNAIRDDLAAANECIERQNANVRRLEADLAAMTERATKAEVELMDHLVGTEGVRRAIVLTQEQTRKAEDALDAALARVAEVEKERDVARKAYCEEAEGTYRMTVAVTGNNRHGLAKTARDVCLRLWPDDADRLFPPEKGGE